jgi:TonB-linked SusC/RagA family outer membrane protein
MSIRSTRASIFLLLSVALALFTAGRAQAKNPSPSNPATLKLAVATITGTVTDAATKDPIPGVQITVLKAGGGTGVGAQTDAQGHYRIAVSQTGMITIRARRIGYGSAEKTVNAAEAQTATLDFALGAAVAALDAVVVTGTPGGTQLRTLGNAIERLDAAKAAEVSPAVNVQQLLGQRTAGVVVVANSGMVGTGSSVRIRGAASLSLANQPIIYVDGVRVDNNASAGPVIRQGRQGARLNDFNPEDIESMEIIKGPAAATLYGTEASNGVIQIITKRGKAGKPKFDVVLKSGANFMPNAEGRLRYTYGINPFTKVLDSVNMIKFYKDSTGKDIFTTGAMRQANLSVSGGSPQVRYFVSGDKLNNTGILDYNWVHSTALRLNLAASPSSKIEVTTNADWIQNETRFGQAADQFGIWEMLVYSSPTLFNTATKGFRYANPEVAASVDSRSKINRFTGGMGIKHTPFTWLTQQIQFGADVGQTANQVLFPRLPDGAVNFYGARSTGEKTLENLTTTFNTVDYSITGKKDFKALTTATSFGAQYYRKQISTYTELGSNFPTSDVTTIGGAATTTAGEDYLENKTLGGYVQEALGWNDRLYLTAALRGDGNSAFGENFKAAYYPKLSGAWVVSEEPFWRWKSINTLRLRSAWGQAGQQPDVFDAVTLYTPTTGPGGTSTLTPGSLGNPALKPERGSELEVGFDMSFFNDRISTTYTHYNRMTTDAIVRAPVQPSAGFPGVRVVNLGKVKAWGNEFTVSANVLNGSRLGWDINANYATSKNRIKDLGGLPPITLGTDQEMRVGYPVGSIFWQKVVHAEFDANGKLTNVLCDTGAGDGTTVACSTSAPKLYYGQPTPTFTGSVTNTFTVLRTVKLSALIDFQGGNMLEDGEIQAGHQNFLNTAQANAAVKDPIFASYQTVVPRAPLGLFKAGFAKLRELSASYALPPRFASKVGASNASLTAAWRNVALLWQAQDNIYGAKLFDSEMHNPGNELAARYQTIIPPSSQVVFTARLSF